MENYQAKGKRINRRSFLKSIATICGAAVACPGELLKGEPLWMQIAEYCNRTFRYKLDYPFRDVTRQKDISYGIPYWIKS